MFLLIITACTAKNCDHDFSSWKVINNATCIDYGMEERSCNECGFIENREIAPTSIHRYEFSHEEKNYCESPSIKFYRCIDCGHTKEEKGAVSSHQYQERVVIEPSCTNEGLKLFECINCGNSYEEQMEKINHDYVLKEIINPNCNENGYEVYECDECHNTYHYSNH